MTRLTLALAIAILLALFVALGWAMHWLWSRPNRREEPLRAHNNALIAKLHAAELARDAVQRDFDALKAAQITDEPDEPDAATTQRLEALHQEAMAAATARDAAIEEAARWRAAYEAVIREDRDDP